MRRAVHDNRPMHPALRVRKSIAIPAVVLCLASGFFVWFCVLSMPGQSFAGRLPALTARERALSAELQAAVVQLSGTIGVRSTQEPEGLRDAADWLESQLRLAGYTPKRQRYVTGRHACDNIEAELPGAGREIVVLGAHYDAVPGTTGADDNASGSAALLALARALHTAKPQRSVRFVWFANEEWPHFQTPAMGSVHYAERSKQRREPIIAMLSLETIGYYSDKPGTQRYPGPLRPFYPSTGNFIAFVSDLSSRDLVRRALAKFRERARFPSEGAALPASLPGIGWSDHWAFWQAGYPAIMVTDTAPFRNPHYHMLSDTPDKLDYARMARVTSGLLPVIQDLAGIR